MEWFIAGLQKYAEFSGRSRRKEYWMYVLFSTLIGIGLAILSHFSFAAGVIYVLFLLGTFIPGFAVFVRRLHDTGRSGWMMLIGLIPLIGAIVILVFLCQDSAPGDNQYGPNPKLAAADAMPA
jgi:uncharacterized membrane protein YhaH (DUF805 family)